MGRADQVRFDREWSSLRSYSASHGIRLIGDLPIYVAPGSADHIAHPDLFQEGEVAGVPPDLFSANGQLWGNPLYRWPVLRATGYRWWVERFRRALELVDLVRLDHFRGLVAYWSVRAGRTTARVGRWRRAPGRELLERVRAELGSLPLVAEDLGLITPAVERLRDDFGLPGMVVLQFAFDGNPHNPYRPENHREHQVVYTGTHDNDTAVGWYRTHPAAELDAAEPNWSLIELAYGSRADMAIVFDAVGLEHFERQRGADEHAVPRDGQLVVAPRAGSAHERARDPAARARSSNASTSTVDQSVVSTSISSPSSSRARQRPASMDSTTSSSRSSSM